MNNNIQTILTTRTQELQQRTQDLIEEYKAVLGSNLTQQILTPLTQLLLWSKTKIKEENIIYTIALCYICPHTLTDCFADEKMSHIFLNLGGYKYDWRDSVVHTLYHLLYEIDDFNINQYNLNFTENMHLLNTSLSHRYSSKSLRATLNRTTLPILITVIDYIKSNYTTTNNEIHNEIQDFLSHLLSNTELQSTLQEESFTAQNVLLKYSMVEAFVEEWFNK